jgi:hypothetical protein
MLPMTAQVFEASIRRSTMEYEHSWYGFPKKGDMPYAAIRGVGHLWILPPVVSLEVEVAPQPTPPWFGIHACHVDDASALH